MREDKPWPFADAWLLLAVRHAGADISARTRSLREVISAADYINHLVLTENEVNDSSRRLSAAGLLRMEGDQLALTDSGCRLIRETQGGSIYDELDRLRARLSLLDVPDTETGQQPSSGSYDRALKDYLAWAEDYLARLNVTGEE